MAKDLAIVLNNGGLNAAVATALAAQKYRPILLYAETVPQPASRRKLAYERQATHFKPYREHTLSMPFLSAVQPTGPVAGPLSDPRHPSAVGAGLLELLPLIAAAMRFAAHYQAAAVYLGLSVGGGADELAQATEFTQIWNELVQLPCGQNELELVAPLLELEPWQIVDVGFQVNAPFEHTWSCLEETNDPCWACRGCRQREAAFVQSAKPDPLRAVRKA